jgi:threonine-phosphate decarboxylase
VLDFSASLNPLGVPPVIRDRWQELMEAIRDYPSISGDGIARFYQDRFGIARENVLSGNGSTEMIYLLPRALSPGRVLIITPSFHDYHRASVLSGAEVTSLPLSDRDFSLDAGVLADACKGVDAVFLGRPNNPTGTMLPPALLTGLAGRFPEKWFIIDEAFIQFADHWEDEALMLKRRPRNLIVIHSLTKFYSLAGLRMGAVIGHADVISRLRAIKEPWTINNVADRAARLLTGCEGYEAETRAYVSGERDRVIKGLNEIKGVMALPSTANFILCRWTGNLDGLLRHLLLNGIYIRDCRNFPGLADNYFRVGLRTPEEDDLLISLISSFPGD